MVHCERSHGCLSGKRPLGRHGDDPMRSLGRPTHLPPPAGVIPSAARVTGGRRARLTHAPTGSLGVDEGIRLGVRVTPAF
jgi:hypothetical protein